MNDLVKNAADKNQIKDAVRKEKIGRDRELNDLRVILNTIEGRRVLWRIMGRCKIHASIWDSSSRIHYNAGIQDIGHYLMAEVAEAGEDFLFQMMREGKER